MKREHDIEKINRDNFRNSLDALARPGELRSIVPLFDSPLLAMASVLLYAEVSHFYEGTLDFALVRALCGSAPATEKDADYLFFDAPKAGHLEQAKQGTSESPELSATLVFDCSRTEHHDSSRVILSGPGIRQKKELILPAPRDFLEKFCDKNDSFPLGIDLFLILADNHIVGLPRTTQIEHIEVRA
ncbi:MAG: phosphonate C-P lyase system protein PhnH [Desulfopila sp.]|jgi:alpha-D-ribose 1-methylphosphonate 5-triphosphate synthase subunit PhnH|nr:phosphonate C-P lyase system protein PhnH [Desulfopila sp.]